MWFRRGPGVQVVCRQYANPECTNLFPALVMVSPARPPEHSWGQERRSFGEGGGGVRAWKQLCQHSRGPLRGPASFSGEELPPFHSHLSRIHNDTSPITSSITTEFNAVMMTLRQILTSLPGFNVQRSVFVRVAVENSEPLYCGRSAFF